VNKELKIPFEITKGRGYVYSIQYHIVWCVKYRHKILTDEIEKKLRELLYKIAEDNEITIIEYNSALDHVHLLVDCRPQHYIPDMLKAFKGVSARFLMKEYDDELKKKLWSEHLWSPSYFVSTVSENTESQIKTYIQSQQYKDGENSGKGI
jgi:putative transposase